LSFILVFTKANSIQQNITNFLIYFNFGGIHRIISPFLSTELIMDDEGETKVPIIVGNN
jgi:hypothetical protein